MEHLVLSSAGPNGFIQLGMIAECMESNLFSMDAIKSIRASSAGAIISVLLCMKIPIHEIIDYFIKRPWKKWLKIDLLQFTSTKGIVSHSCFLDMIAPFFHTNDISVEITMKEFYELTNIDLHIFTTSVKKLNAVDLNHATFPELSVIQAVSMSASVPIVFTPILYRDEYYVDGGLLIHCPVSPYPETTLVIMIDITQPMDLESPFQFMQHILVQTFNIICANTQRPIAKHVFCYDSGEYCIDPNLWERVLMDESYRKEMVDIGKKFIMNKIDLSCKDISSLNL